MRRRRVIAVIDAVKRSYGEWVDAKVEDVPVPGATLHVESRGAGPLLLLVVGGNGDCTVFEGMAAALADRFTVVTWDRRGFVRSPLDGPVGDKLTADVEDAALLVRRAGAGPAHVFGSSSGAIVALHVLVRHPDLVATVVAHEPPLFPLLPDGDDLLAQMEGFYQRFRADGPIPAMTEFSAAMGIQRGEAPSEVPPRYAEMMARAAGNMTFWFENELQTYPSALPDLDALRAAGERLVLACGRDSRGHPPYRPNEVLAQRFGRPIVEFPGGHVRYAQAAAEFSAVLAGVLGADARSADSA
jgi:acetyltransferase/esterase